LYYQSGVIDRYLPLLLPLPCAEGRCTCMAWALWEQIPAVMKQLAIYRQPETRQIDALREFRVNHL
jgi:hypothetical protein